MNAQEILTGITLAVSGWTLLEVISLKVKVGMMQQRVDDLPCSDCPPLGEEK